MAVSRPVRCSIQSMTLRMGLRRSDLELASVDLHHVAVERSRCWTRQNFPIDRKRGSMAGTDKRVGCVVPMISAAQMRAVGGKGSHLPVGLFHDPGRRLLAGHFPAIHAVALE